MADLSSEVQGAIGGLAQVPVGLPTPVVAVPDNYVPPLQGEGVVAVTQPAGGAGQFSQVFLELRAGPARKLALIEITDLQFSVATGPLEIRFGLEVGGAVGGTTISFSNADTRDVTRPFNVFRRAAAPASTLRLIASVPPIFAIPVKVPGRFLLSGAERVGTNVTALIFQNATANELLDVFFRWRLLEARKL